MGVGSSAGVGEDGASTSGSEPPRPPGGPTLPTRSVVRPDVDGRRDKAALAARRNYRWHLLRAAQELGYLEGISRRCLTRPRPLSAEEREEHKTTPVVTVRLQCACTDHGGPLARLVGYERCHSKVQCVWCSPAEATKEAQLVNTAVAHHYGGRGGEPRWFADANGPGVYLLTLTPRHKKGDYSLEVMKDWLARAWKLVLSESLSEQFGDAGREVVEWIRAWDYTNSSKTGHHPTSERLRVA